MIKPRHTPGPWRLNLTGQTIVSNQSHPVATLSDPFHRQCAWGTGNDGPLIAAAPEMLALLIAADNKLEAMRKYHSGASATAIDGLRQKIGAVIAKATDTPTAQGAGVLS